MRHVLLLTLVSCAQPRISSDLGAHPERSYFGDIDTTAIQGVASSETRWFFSNRTTIYAASREPDVMTFERKTALPEVLVQQGYNHIGDLDAHEGLVFVPVTNNGHDAVPLLLVYDEALSLLSWGRMRGGGTASWISVNPIDGLAYTSQPFTELFAFDLRGLVSADVPFDATEGDLPLVRHLHMTFSSLSEEDRKTAWVQGGAFADDGTLFYVFDEGEAMAPNPNAGIYLLRVTEAEATQLPAGDATHLFIEYTPNVCGLFCYRPAELQGIDVGPDMGDGMGSVHQLFAEPFLGEDAVWLLHYQRP